jgi:GNAT superfamily N-acetyltransferase
MTEKGVSMPKKPLPTGEEPRKGYESVVNLDVNDESLTIDSVVLSQLARLELAEIETLRSRALSFITTLIGLTDDTLTFEKETNLIAHKSASEKLLFRAYLGKKLVGYALVIISWPNQGEWVIQHMIIDPQYRLKGIGTGIVTAIEELASSAEVGASAICAIPVQESGIAFWQDKGYCELPSGLELNDVNTNREFFLYRKEFS